MNGVAIGLFYAGFAETAGSKKDALSRLAGAIH